MYSLKLNENGKVNACLRAGKDIVITELTEDSVRKIIDNGQIKESNLKGFNIAVDDWFFEGELNMNLPIKNEEVETEEVEEKPVRKSPFSKR